VLRYILPDRRHHSYCLRPKRHELTLGAILETSSNDFCLKTCINILLHILAIFTACICIIM